MFRDYFYSFMFCSSATCTNNLKLKKIQDTGIQIMDTTWKFEDILDNPKTLGTIIIDYYQSYL